MIKKCLICQRKFSVDSWSIKHRAANYCSHACGHLSRKTGEFRKCKQCKKLFYIIPSHLKRRKNSGQFCSKECMWKSPIRNLKLTGVNNYHWKGGIGTERHQLMQKRDYILWRIAVFIRDDYTCQKCNVKGGVLNAHHIKSWELYPEIRYAIDNGQTLCIDCHKIETWGSKITNFIELTQI